MATRVDAEAGWQIFKDSHYALTRDEVNGRLQKEGYAPISDRTFRHYRKLVRNGYDFYIPINQLDVKTLEDPVWDKATRNRYVPRQIDVPVRVATSDAERLWAGTAILISDGVVVIRLKGELATFTEMAKRGTALVVTFIETGEVRNVTLENVSFDVTSGAISLRFTFDEFRAADRLANTQPLPLSRAHVVVDQGDANVLLGTIVQQVFWIFEALEVVRIGCDEVIRTVDPNSRRSLSPPVLVHIRLESPLEILLEGSNPYVVAFVLLLGRLLAYRKRFYEGSVAKQEARRLRWEQDQRELKTAVGVETIGKRVIAQLSAHLDTSGGTIQVPEEARRQLAESLTSALPHLLRLAESGEGLDVGSPIDNDDE